MEDAKEEEGKEEEEKEESKGGIADSVFSDDFAELSYDQLLVRLSKQGDKYEPIAHRVSAEIADKIIQADLNGIRLQPEDWRYYPENSLASQVLGFVGF